MKFEFTQDQAELIYERIKAAQPDMRGERNYRVFDTCEEIMKAMEEVDPALSR